MSGDLYLPDELKEFILYDETYSDRMKGCLIHFYNYLFIRHISCPVKRKFKSYKGICINKNIVNFTYKQERINNKREHIYYEILEFLTNNNFIDVVKTKSGKSFTIGVKSKHYTLLDRSFKNVNIINIEDFNSKIQKTIGKIGNVLFYTPNTERKCVKRIKLSKKSDVNINVEVNEKEVPVVIENNIITRTCFIIKDIYKNMIDRDGFYAYINTLPSDKVNDKIMSLKNFNDKIYANISPKTGRLFSNFTGLSRDIRDNFLNYKWSIDVKNAQFVFLSVLLKNDLTELTDDTIKFIKLCADGTLYEYMMNILNEDRNYVKKWMYHLAFDSNLAKYEIWGTLGNKALFKKEFPQVFDYMKNFKKEKGFTIVTALQQIESEIFVDNLLKEYINDYKVLSLHDSIYCFDEKLSIDVVENKLKEICNTLNIYCNIHKHFK